MSETLQEKRADDRPNTFVMHAIKNMTPEDRRFYRKVGLGFSCFPLSACFVAEVALQFAGYPEGIWGGIWGVAVLVFLAGTCFMFPALGMWLVKNLPQATDKLIPNKVREVLGKGGEP